MDKTSPNNGNSNSGNYITGGTFNQTSFASGKGSEAKTIVASDQGRFTSADLIVELEKLRDQFAQASQIGIIDKGKSTVAQEQITKAMQQAKESSPDKKTIIDRLSAVKLLIEDITTASGLVTAIVGAIEVVKKLF